MSELTAKEKLLEAAIAVIDEKGEAGVRVDDLLAEVGVTAPTLYHHFGNREGLVIEAQAVRFNRIARPNFDMFIEAVQKVQTLEELHATIDLIFKLLNQTPLESRFKRLNAIGSAYARPGLAQRIVETNDQLSREIAGVLRPFQQKGWIRQDIDLEVVVSWYNGAAIGRMLLDMAPSELNTAMWAPVMVDAIRHLLFGEPTQSAH